MKQFWIRVSNMVIGLLLYGLGIAITIKAGIGYAPWEVFHAGLAGTIGLGIGATSIIVGILIAAIVTALGEKMGLGTLTSMVLTGVFLDIMLASNIIPTAENFAIGTIMLVVGLFVVSTGAYFYIRSAFGAGPRDNLMVVMARKAKLPIGVCRGIVDLLVTLMGWVLGGMVGVGTVISVVAAGFCIQIVFRLFGFDATAVKHETLDYTIKTLFHHKSK